MTDHKDFIIEEATVFTPEITGSVIHLIKQLDESAHPLTHEEMQEIVDAPHTRLFFAKGSSDNKIVGMATLVTYRIPYKRAGTIEDVVVDSEYRRRGIGESLMNYVVQKARNEGITSLSFTSRPGREEANRLYARLGFEKRDTNVYRIDL